MAFYSNDEFRGNGEAAGFGVPIMSVHSDNSYPKLLYRPSGVERPDDDDGAQIYERNLIHGKALDTALAASDNELEVLIAEGWHLSPETTDAPIETAPRKPGRPRRVVS